MSDSHNKPYLFFPRGHFKGTQCLHQINPTSEYELARACAHLTGACALEPDAWRLAPGAMFQGVAGSCGHQGIRRGAAEAASRRAQSADEETCQTTRKTKVYSGKCQSVKHVHKYVASATTDIVARNQRLHQTGCPPPASCSNRGVRAWQSIRAAGALNARLRQQAP